MIWYEHLRFMGNFGSVESVKVDELDDGRVQLLARLQPNARLLELNGADQKLFTSIEIQPDFGGTGKAGLVGLAITDQPASLGTEALHFRRRAPAGNYFGSLEPLGSIEATDSQALSIFTRILQRLSGDPASDSLTPETPTMDEKTVKHFSAAVDKLDKATACLDAVATTFATLPKAALAPAEAVEATGVAVTQEQFSALERSLNALTQQFSTALSQTTGKPFVQNLGAVDDQPEAIY